MNEASPPKRASSSNQESTRWWAPPCIALELLTILPSPLRRLAKPAERGLAAGYFPLVGLLLGALVAALDRGLTTRFPGPVAGALDLATLALLSGGLHLDGLMDSADGVFGGRDREARLAILKDSRIGSFGATAGILVLLIQFSCLSTLAGSDRTIALVLAPTLSRWGMALAISAFPAARPGGLGAAFKTAHPGLTLALATLWPVLATVTLLGPIGLGALALAAMTTALLGVFISRRLGGLTGDSYGAIGEVTTTVILLAIVAAAGR